MSDDDEDIGVPEDETETVYPSQDVSDLKRLSVVWSVKMTQIQMIQDRGYELTPLSRELKEKAQNPELFWNLLSSLLVEKSSPATIKKKSLNTEFWDLLTERYKSKKNPNVENLVVFLPPPRDKAFPTGRLTTIIKSVKREPSIRFLDVIYEFPMSRVTRTKLAASGRYVAEWSYPELKIPITKSIYVGNKFTVITAQEFADDYGVENVAAARAGLPELCRDDPLVRYFQWIPDTVIRSIEIGDVNVAVTRVLKDYIVTSKTLFAVVDSADQQPKTGAA